jgi:hypothetical protein
MKTFPGLPLLLLTCACSGSSASLQFHNGRDGALKQGLNERAPTTFGMKLLAVYLAEDVDPTTQNNIGRTQLIYLNPVCDEDIGHCEISPGTNPQDGQPYTHLVTDFFDFAGSSAEVNAAIGAQQRPIEVTTYRYTRMEFCKGNEGHATNVRWAADGAAANEFVYGGCGVTSAVMEPALTVTANDQVTVTLSYDLATSVRDEGQRPSPGNSGPIDCRNGACFALPSFTPSAALAP